MRRLTLVLCLLISGCNSVWMHPQASPQKYAQEQTACRALQRPGFSWRDCMHNLGWDSERRMFAFSNYVDTNGGTGRVVKPLAQMQAEAAPPKPAPAPVKSWVNANVSPRDYVRALGTTKAGCIERAYVGQRTAAQGNAHLTGGGLRNVWHGVDGRAASDYESAPNFDQELFEACMNAAGWEFR